MRERIAEARRAAGISSDLLAPLRPTQYRRVLRRVLETFTVFGEAGEDRRWLWEGLREPSFALPVEPGQVLLSRLVPPTKRVWFITEDWDGEKNDGNFWVFEGQVDAIEAVLNELFLFEYYVVDKSFAWLLCENHHNTLIGVGRPVVERMKLLASA